MGNRKILDLPLSDFGRPGLYLIFEDSTRLALTRENTEKITEEFWRDPEKIPQSVKEAVEFQRCGFCPLKEEADFCDALRPILPFLPVIDRYSSFDEVTALFKGEEKQVYHVSHTSMQRALRYISSMSLMSYCQVGRKYRKYFSGINPLMKTDEIANRIYLNIYWVHDGNMEIVDRIISRFSSEITATTKNQIKRLQQICKNDAFLNAFILTHLVTDSLNENRDKKLRAQLERFEQRQ